MIVKKKTLVRGEGAKLVQKKTEQAVGLYGFFAKRQEKLLLTYKNTALTAVFFHSNFAISNLAYHTALDEELHARLHRTVLILLLHFSDRYHEHLSRT